MPGEITRKALLIFLIFVVPLGGCGRDEDEGGRIVASKSKDVMPAWLTPRNHVEPALWLRTREVGHDVLPDDPEVDRLRRALNQASVRFYEDTRMIANRTAQTRDMLVEANEPELSVDIMTGMVDVADAAFGRKHYGEMCQQYLNLRRKGVSRSDAPTQLTAKYRTGFKKY
jgi:hypothetical protein